MDDMKLFISSFGNSSGIIYVRQREAAEKLCQELNAFDMKAGVYHAGKKTCEKQKVLKDWLSNSLRIICCTVAFGMGIDKPDVRFVIHFNLPTSLENFYQESGRAGRDGLPSCSRLYFFSSDFSLLQGMSRGKEHMPSTYLDKCSRGLEALYAFCNESICRRKQLVKYFGETLDSICDSCDICCSTEYNTISPASSNWKMNDQRESLLSKCSENPSLTGRCSDISFTTFCKASTLLAEGRKAERYEKDSPSEQRMSETVDCGASSSGHKRPAVEVEIRKEDGKGRIRQRQTKNQVPKTQHSNQKTLSFWFSESVGTTKSYDLPLSPR
jgi:superfamily II DNA helicase RecQ